MDNDFGKFVEELKATATVPASFNWFDAEANSLLNAGQSDLAQAVREAAQFGETITEDEAAFNIAKATILDYIDQGVSSY